MNKKFTKLIAALALLVFMAPSLAGWGQSTYTKVTTAPADWSGTYVIIADASEVIFTGQKDSYTYGGYDNVTITNGSVTGDFSNYEVLVEKSGDYYTMKHISSEKYLGWNTGNNLHFSTQEPTSDAFKWVLSVSSILNANEITRKLQYNSGSPRFACYTSTQKVAYLYLKESGGTPTVATPTFDPGEGTYTETQTVEISCTTEGATIYYTLNGNDPTTESVEYTEALTIEETTTVKAMAVKEGYNNSAIATATYTITEAPTPGENEYQLYSGALEEGDYVIYYNGKAMKNTISSNRLDYEEVTPSNDVISNPVAAIVWHIAPSGDYWTIYNAVVAKYAAGNGTKNQATLLDDGTDNGSLWTVTGEATYEFVNKKNDEANVNKNLRNNGTYGFACYGTGTGGALSLYKLAGDAPTNPSITADNVAITHDATGGSIAYTINNPVANGTISAAVTEGNWLTLDSGTESPISFTCSANPSATERTATVTLTYTYSQIAEAVTKDVTVTQAAAPVIYTTIPDLFEAATSTATNISVTFDNWVVSGVSTNGKNVFVTDGTNGFVIFDNGGELGNTYTVGNILSGTVECSLKLNQGYAQLTNVNAGNLTIATGGTVTVANIDMANLAGVYTGALVSYENLTCSVDNNKYYLSDGTTTVQIYNSLYTDAYSTLVAGKTYNITGIYQQYGSTKEILPRSAADIEDVTPSEPTITVDPATVEFDYNQYGGTLDLTYQHLTIDDMNDFGIQYYNAEGEETEAPNWIEVLVAEQDPSEGEGYVVSYVLDENDGAARTAYFKVFAMGDEGFVYSNLVTISQGAAPATFMYSYSINGVEDENTYEVVEGNSIILAEGAGLNETFVFAGWTTDPDDVENRLTGSYTPTEEVTTFYATYTKATSGTRTAANYVKVTSTDDIEDGDYLIVYEDGALAFDGGRDNENELLDAVSNTIDLIYLNDGVIASNETTDAAVFTIAAIDGGYSIQSASGYYIGQTSDANGMAVNNNETIYTNSISIDENYNATIISGGAYMRYNSTSNQARFRYYKSSSYTNQKAIQLYKKQGGSAPTPIVLPTYFTRVFLNETVADDIEITGPSIIPSGSVLDMGEAYAIYNSLDATRLIIEDGAQLFTIVGVEAATMQKNIAAHGTEDGWYFIASPINSGLAVSGLITDDLGIDATAETATYDLYYYNEPSHEWKNYRKQTFDLNNGQGYLYASKQGTLINFAGELQPCEATTSGLDYTEDNGNTLAGWNLVGNPFACNAIINKDFYVINGMNVVANTDLTVIAPCTGVMVRATSDVESVTFTPVEPSASAPQPSQLQMTVAQNVMSRGITASTVNDNAIVNFRQGSQLEKFVFNADAAKLYIPQNDKEYAIVSAEAQGEMPVNFHAAKNGTYTLTINPEGVEMNYLHLIDNMTGADIDLLAATSTGSVATYTFNASTTDYSSRFRLVFAANNEDGVSTGSTAFAFYSNGTWVINNTGEATLQVVDVNGRILSSETVNGSVSKAINTTAGVYMLRLVSDNDVKTQKIVVR